MSDTNPDTLHSPDTAVEPAPAASDAPVKRSRPSSRKVGTTRSKATADPAAAVSDGASDGAASRPAPRRSRKSPLAAVAASALGEEEPSKTPPAPEALATPAPAAPEAILPRESAASEETDPQTHIETHPIPPGVIRTLEAKTTENFGRPAAGSPLPELTPAAAPAAPSPSPQAPPPAPPASQPPPPASRFHPDRRHQPHDGRGRDRDRDRFGQRDRGGNFGGGGGNNNHQSRPQGGQPQGPPRHQDAAAAATAGDDPGGYGGQGGQGQWGGGQGPAVHRPAEPQFAEGMVEVSGKGFGFLREAKRNFVQTPNDIFVTPEVCRRYDLRDGIFIKGEIRRSSRGPQLFRLTSLNGEDPDKVPLNRLAFDELTTINPRQRIKLETEPTRYTTRVMDLMTPVGKGQRGLIVAPPRTGKTTLLQHIGEAVVKNHPDMHLIILLVDERPEEVTEIRRAVPQAEIMASSNDNDLKSHTKIATLAIDRAKRLVESGREVFLLLDSITRMGRAFNNALGGSGGATMSGGIGSRALEIPRKIFAAARNTEEAGSLTIIATALIETGSRMDDVIFQEFKGTGNMELVLDRKISDLRIYPAVDIFQSGTRREELLLAEWELDKINVIRRGLAGHKPVEAIERLLSFLKKFPTNAQMLASLPG